MHILSANPNKGYNNPVASGVRFQLSSVEWAERHSEPFLRVMGGGTKEKADTKTMERRRG